jgi:hypothetical protein
MEEVSEIYIILKGEIKIGFRLNHLQNFVLKGDDMFFGAYNVTFNKRSMYVFRISARCKENHGYFIRKTNWIKLTTELSKENRIIEELIERLKEKLDQEYQDKLMLPMIKHKNDAMKKFTRRSDYQHIMGVAVIEKSNTKKAANDTTAMDMFNKPTDINEMIKQNNMLGHGTTVGRKPTMTFASLTNKLHHHPSMMDTCDHDNAYEKLIVDLDRDSFIVENERLMDNLVLKDNINAISTLGVSLTDSSMSCEPGINSEFDETTQKSFTKMKVSPTIRGPTPGQKDIIS